MHLVDEQEAGKDVVQALTKSSPLKASPLQFLHQGYAAHAGLELRRHLDATAWSRTQCPEVLPR